MHVFVTKYILTRHRILHGTLLALDADTGRAAIRLRPGDYALVDAEDWYASLAAAQRHVVSLQHARPADSFALSA